MQRLFATTSEGSGMNTNAPPSSTGLKSQRRWERMAYAVLAAAAFGQVVYAALRMPINIDEAFSFVHYAQEGTFLPFRSFWYSNNHLLNSACGWVGYSIAGLHPLSLRWASVLAFIPYAYAAWRMGLHVRHVVVRWCLFSASLWCPFLVDYFSLFRGYGPALAALLIALEALIAYASDRSIRHLWRALIGLLITNGFVLAFLPLCALAIAYAAVLAHRNRKHLRLVVFAGALPLCPAILYAVLSKRNGLLDVGGTDGFIENTAGSLALFVFGASGAWVAHALVAVGAIAVVAVAIRWSRSRSVSSPSAIIAALLVVESLVRIVAAHVISLNYASDRTALHTLMLGIMTVAFAADAQGGSRRWQWCFALVLLVFPMRKLTAPREVLGAISDRFAQRVAAWELEYGRPAIVATEYPWALGWSVQRRMLGSEGDLHSMRGACDVIVWPRAFTMERPAFYAVADSSSEFGLDLLVREPALALEPLDEAMALEGFARADQEIRWPLPAEALRAQELFVQVEGFITTTGARPGPRLRFVAVDSADVVLQEDMVDLRTRRSEWAGEGFTTLRRLSRAPSTGQAWLSLGMTGKGSCGISSGRVMLWTVASDQRQEARKD